MIAENKSGELTGEQIKKPPDAHRVPRKRSHSVSYKITAKRVWRIKKNFPQGSSQKIPVTYKHQKSDPRFPIGIRKEVRSGVEKEDI